MKTNRDVFQAIADANRRKIIKLVAYEDLTLSDIAGEFDNISRPAVSQHVKILTECGLLIVEKKGRERYCKIQPEKLVELDKWLEPFRQMWEDRFNELDDVLNKLKEEKSEQNKNKH